MMITKMVVWIVIRISREQEKISVQLDEIKRKIEDAENSKKAS